jgi:hypothetical protein
MATDIRRVLCVFNGMHPANIPYAKEIFWMPNYWQAVA